MADYGPRIRAARGWANLTQDELAERLGRDKQFVGRRELPPSHDRWQKPSRGDLIAIAAICGVPTEFLTEGFAGQAASEISERLGALEVILRDVQRELAVHAVERQTQSGGADSTDEDLPGQQPL